jgi:hypothetical protein
MQMPKFDYSAPAELYMPKRNARQHKPIGYRRFATAAEAIRFAVEDFPTVRTFGPWMQIGDERFDCEEIHRLYEGSGYPLRRITPPT